MSHITDEEWELLRQYFGDIAYEEPHNHQRWLAVIRGIKEIEAGEVEDMDDVLDDMDAIIASGDMTALEIFDRAPDVPPDPGDEMPE